VFLVSWPTTGEAQDERPLTEAIRVEPGATCVTHASLVPQVEAWLGTARVDAELELIVRGHVSDPRDVALEIRRAGDTVGQRRFHPAPFVCAQLEASLALAIAMGIKVSLREELLSALAPSTQQRSALSGHVRLGSGLLPRASLGGSLGAARALSSRFALRAEASADSARGARFDTAPGSFDTLLLSGLLSGCALFPLASGWAARACLGVALGALEARGRGYSRPHTDWLAWIAASNSLALSARVAGHWWLDLPCSLVSPLNKVSFGVARDDGSVAGARGLPRVGFTLALGPQYVF